MNGYTKLIIRKMPYVRLPDDFRPKPKKKQPLMLVDGNGNAIVDGFGNAIVVMP
jgi:hypothetical protein